MIEKTQIGAVILAGGKASRMAFADKALTPLHGVALLDYVLARSRDQVQQLTLSVNHNLHAYQKFGLALISDKKNIYGGPLLGIYSAMLWYRDILQDKNIKYLACFAADVPVFPSNLVKLLADKLLAESADSLCGICSYSSELDLPSMAECMGPKYFSILPKTLRWKLSSKPQGCFLISILRRIWKLQPN
jgi:molybdopterin-guanine dinucleotide biosynthesis protein A